MVVNFIVVNSYTFLDFCSGAFEVVLILLILMNVLCIHGKNTWLYITGVQSVYSCLRLFWHLFHFFLSMMERGSVIPQTIKMSYTSSYFFFNQVICFRFSEVLLIFKKCVYCISLVNWMFYYYRTFIHYSWPCTSFEVYFAFPWH